MKRPLNDIIDKLVDLKKPYSYFIDFNTAVKLSDGHEELIKELSEIAIDEDFESNFKKLFEKNKEIVKLIPALLAIRGTEVDVIDNVYDFKTFRNSAEEYIRFLNETGFLPLYKSGKIKSLSDYLLGVEVGINTNARKNRGGNLMPEIIRYYLKKADIEFFEEVSEGKLEEIFGIKSTKTKKKDKRFDFVFKGKSGNIYLCECNAFSGTGSKLNSEFVRFANEQKMINETYPKNISFLWFTDGRAIKTALNDFAIAYEEMEHIYTTYDLENGILLKL